MHRYAFKQFESSSSDNQHSDTQLHCNLDDHMFKCYVHWYVRPGHSIDKEKLTLAHLANMFDVVLCLWRLVTQDNLHFTMVDIKAIADLAKLPDFLDQALQVSRPTLVTKKFQVLSICIINKYGSFEAEKCYSVCQKCGDEERLNECCGQFVCGKCDNGKVQGCPYCGKRLEVCPVPLEIVATEQSKRIYQPMFPDLTLEQRFQLMDMIECDFDYN